LRPAAVSGGVAHRALRLTKRAERAVHRAALMSVFFVTVALLAVVSAALRLAEFAQEQRLALFPDDVGKPPVARRRIGAGLHDFEGRLAGWRVPHRRLARLVAH